MKATILTLLSYLPLFLIAQTNYITNGGFESSSLGTSPNVTTGNGTMNNTLAGQWQTTFVSSSSTGTSQIVNTAQNSGSNAIYITITKQTNRNDIKLLQVIPNTTIPPAAPCVLTFYLKGGNAGDSVVANVFKSTAASNANGASGDATQPANLYIATTNWKMCKMYVDLTNWTTTERTNMRISIRPNTGLSSSPTPSEPYPKYYWFDDISFFKVDSLHEMHEMAISVAMDRRQTAQDSGFTAEVSSLTTSINAMLADTAHYVPVVPTNAVGFNPTIIVTDTTNPYINALYSWAASYLADNTQGLAYPKAVRGEYVNFPAGSIVARSLGSYTENMHWLLVSPYSKYRYNPELFRRFLTIVYATSDDYQVNGGTGVYGTPGSTLDALNDWFAAAKSCYAWWMVAQSFPSGYIPSVLNQRLLDAADTMGKVHRGWADSIYSYNYTNRDISYAQILMNLGLFRGNSNWVSFAKQIVDSVNIADRFPDGAYAYLGHQNETEDYHGGTNNSLAKIWAVSGYQPAWDCVSKTANYEIMNLEPRAVPEYYTAPAWKSMWNMTVNASAEPLVAMSGSGYYRAKLNQINLTAGYGNEMVVSLAFYKPSIAPLSLPSSFLVYDRNIQGPRGRYGNYSYGVSLRNVAPTAYASGVLTPVGNLGMPTLVGSMVTQALSNANTQDSIVNSVLMLAGSQVHVNLSTPASPVLDWGFMMTQISPLVCVSRTAASASTPSILQRQYSGPKAKATNWSSNQHWITLPDRMIGYVETFPTNSTGTTSAYEITGRLRFTYGRNGILNPQTLVIDTLNKQYTYGSLRTIIKGYDFNQVDTAYAGVLENAAPFNAYDIVFKCDSSNGTSLYNYSGKIKKYFMVEIRNINATGNTLVTKISNGKLSGLIVKLNGNIYSSYRNDSTGTMTLNISNSIVADSIHITQAHYARTDSTLIQPQIITSNTFSLAANQQVLIVSSSNLNDIGKGWENFNETLSDTGIYPNAGTTWSGAYNSSWTANGNWSNGAPNTNMDVVVTAAIKQPAVNATQAVKKLIVNNNATVAINGNLQVNDSLTNNGAIVGNGFTTLAGSSPQKIMGIGSISNLAIANGNGVSIASGSNKVNITGTLNLSNGNLNTNGNLVLKSNSIATASLVPIQSGASITGNITVERYIPAKTARKNIFISSPVSQQINNAWQQQVYITGSGVGGAVCGNVNSNGFDVTLTNKSSLYTYSAAFVNNSRWVSVPNTNATSLMPGVGYAANIRGTRGNGGGCNNQLNTSHPAPPDSVVLSATGAYSTSPTATVYGTTSYGANPAYTLLGNPYPCALNASAFIAANSSTVTGNLWMYPVTGNTARSYGSWNKATKISTGYWPTDYSADNVTDVVVPSGSAFFVEKTDAADGTVSFSEQQKAASPKGSVTIFGSPPSQAWNNKLRCTLLNTDSSFVGDAVVLFGSDTAISNEAYTHFDTYCLNTETPPYIATAKKKWLLSVNTKRLAILSDTVPLLVYNNTASKFMLHFTDFGQFERLSSIKLQDNFVGTTQEITANPFYSFATTGDSNSHSATRFQLVFGRAAPLPIKNIALQAAKVQEKALLHWQVTGTASTRYFEIGQSADGNAFANIDSVSATNQPAYSYTCNTVPQGNTYYRVKAVSTNGEILYSNIAEIKNRLDNFGFALYPNPSKNKRVNLQISNAANGNYTVIIYNNIGAEIASQPIFHTGGNSSYPLRFPSTLLAGNYTIVVKSFDGQILYKAIFVFM
ncbi:hypothetical protein [Parasediminibacterium sp. JCM 36343]|uniref:hypothetical protein n=1 Tax=Parasediminibacterium sp. JCM 36343 TaxID=3374279 RepID=UPI00397D9651